MIVYNWLFFSFLIFCFCLLYFLAGTLLIFYICLSNHFRGKTFFTLNFVIDTTFEIIYCLFPLLYLSGNDLFDLSSLGILGQQNGFIIIQSLFAMIVVSRKCILLMIDLNPTSIARSHWSKVQNHIKTDHLKPWIVDKTYDRKVRYQGFGNSDLYRLVVARFENESINSPRFTTVNIAGIGNTRISAIHSNAVNVDLDKLSKAETQGNVASLHSASLSHVTSTSISTSPHLKTNSATQDEIEMYAHDGDGGESPRSISAEDTPNFIHDGPGQGQGQEQQTQKARINIPSSKCRNIFTVQCKRKSIVGGCGGIFVAIGILILVFFIQFINQDYEEKCFYNNYSDNVKKNDDWQYYQWYESHPELKYFYRNCYYPVVNIFNGYPCNCRQYTRYPEGHNASVDEFSPQMIELVFLNYNNLENIYMEISHSDYDNWAWDSYYYFTNEMLGNTKYLKIWNMKFVEIDSISNEGNKTKLYTVYIGKFFIN